MEKKELRSVTSLGMFDMLKGFTILMVIWIHSVDAFVESTEQMASKGLSFFLCFYIAAGYGLRPRPLKTTLKQVKRMFLRPYVITAAGSLLAMFAVYSFGSRTLSELLRDGLPLLAGMLLGQMPEGEYFGFPVAPCGPIWFLLSLAESWILVSLSLKKLGEKKTGILALLLCLLAPYYELADPMPYVLNRLTIGFPGLYIGYLLQKKAWLEKRLPWWAWVLLALCFGFHKLDDLGLLFYLKPLRGITDYALSFALVYLFTHINRRYCLPVGVLEYIGHNSLIWLCLHTVEVYAAPWAYFIFLLQPHITIPPLVGTVVLMLLRSLMIWAGSYVIAFAKNRLEEWGVIK